MMFNKKILVLLIFLMPLVMNCRTGSSASRQHKNESQKKEKDKAIESQYHDAIKKHEKGQTKETRKRMKENKKRSEVTHVEHKKFFLCRWLSRKPKSCVPAPTN